MIEEFRFCWRQSVLINPVKLVFSFTASLLLFSAAVLANNSGTKATSAATSSNQNSKSVKKAKLPQAKKIDPGGGPAEVVPSLPPTREEIILQGRQLFSYKSWVGDYQPRTNLAASFPGNSSALPLPELQNVQREWVQAGPRFEALRAAFERQQSSQRGEFELQTVRQGVENLFKVSLLRLRLMAADQVSIWMMTEGAVWSQALAVIPFEESSVVALRFVSEMRSLYAQEFLAKIKALNPEGLGNFPLAELSRYLEQSQNLWPIDRIFLMEARKSLQPAAQLVANGIASDLQKYPFRTAEQLRKIRKGADLPGLRALDSVWTADDVKKRQNEEDLFNELRLRIEVLRYQQMNAKRPENLQQLVAAGLIAELPHCHKTDQIWNLTQL